MWTSNGVRMVLVMVDQEPKVTLKELHKTYIERGEHARTIVLAFMVAVILKPL